MDSDSYDDSDSDIMPSGLLAMEGCAVCTSSIGLLKCGGCKVENYCSTAHQAVHRFKHKAICGAIKKTREKLEREEAKLRARPASPILPADVFNTCVGRFWGILDTRDYMRARFAAASALLEVKTVRAVEIALEHFNDMLRLCRSDNLGVRDIVPFLLLRLGREQECYDFLKWWATVDDKDHYNGNYNWGDVSLPYLDIRNADAFESIDVFLRSGHPSLSHLVALTLLKLRFWLDLSACPKAQADYGLGYYDADTSPCDRPIGQLIREAVRAMDVDEVAITVGELEQQFRELCQIVFDDNSYFWEALVEEETPSPPQEYIVGTKEEADLVLYHCLPAWQETEDAIMMIDSATSKFIRAYEGTAGGSQGLDNLERKRGTGNVFPSKFQPPLAMTDPSDLFSPTQAGTYQNARFISRTDARSVLVYTDGACADNGQANPRAGWAVVSGTARNGGVDESIVVSGRLEDEGPFGDVSEATSNRAELRAVIAVLRLNNWKSEGHEAIVIATDSAYVVDGATGWAKNWVRNGWKTNSRNVVKNKDLWELLLGEVERWNEQGLRIELWKIPRELNTQADAAAKQAAATMAAEAEFQDVTTSLPQNVTTESVLSRGVLALCLDNMFDDLHKYLISQITSKVKMNRAMTPNSALAMLTQEAAPPVILVVDGGLARERKVWERVIDRLRGGATVVLAGSFSSMLNEGEFARLFARIGLPWKRGSYHRATVTLRRGNVDGHLADRLPSAYSQKAQFVKNIDKATAWYTEKETASEAAVVFANVGAGRLGYVGDVNAEKASNEVVLAMCGLLD